jgi:hypothetical protein
MREVLAQVESVTRYPVHVQPDQNLNVLATVKIANSSVLFTVIRVRPDAIDTNEYVVCFQCGFVLRQTSLPSGDRWDIAASDRGRKELDLSVDKSVQGKLSSVAGMPLRINAEQRFDDMRTAIRPCFDTCSLRSL